MRQISVSAGKPMIALVVKRTEDNAAQVSWFPRSFRGRENWELDFVGLEQQVKKLYCVLIPHEKNVRFPVKGEILPETVVRFNPRYPHELIAPEGSPAIVIELE